MKIEKLTITRNKQDNPKLNQALEQLIKFFNELDKREISDDIVKSINQDISELNSKSWTDKELKKSLKKKQKSICKIVEKEHKLVPEHYYRKLWMMMGMGAFGLPFGVVYSVMIGNMAFIGLGLPIGMAIGMAVGASMDKKAKEEERQLEVEFTV